MFSCRTYIKIRVFVFFNPEKGNKEDGFNEDLVYGSGQSIDVVSADVVIGTGCIAVVFTSKVFEIYQSGKIVVL